MADYDISDVSESSWADARADTPTLGEKRSDSEDTLSNLSLDDFVGDNHIETNGGVKNGSASGNKVQSPVINEEVPRSSKGHPSGSVVVNPPQPNTSEEEEVKLAAAAEGALSASSSTSFASAVNGSVRVCVTDADIGMADSTSLDLPRGAQYMPTSVDFPRSPSQLKIQKGKNFMPQEDPGAISEDESSVSSYRAHLDLNLLNGDVRLTKKGFSSSTPTDDRTQIKPNFLIPNLNLDNFDNSSEVSEDNDESISIIVDDSLVNLDHPSDLDDYIEDFILPHSHESVMSRQLSFRRTVKQTLENVAAKRASEELEKFDTMLSTYDEVDENGGSSRSMTPDLQNNPNYIPTFPVAKSRKSKTSENNSHHHIHHQRKANFDLDPSYSIINPETMGTIDLQSLDIDAIVTENAPNLMGYNGKRDLESLAIGGNELESMSNYFLPPQTLEKLHAVYESSNFNNIYCLSGEIKNILSATEIEEIVANKDHLERFIDPNVMAALSWSLNPASLLGLRDESLMVSPNNPNDPVKDLTLIENGLKSKSSSISNGFHSDASSCEDDNHSTTSSSGGIQVPNDDSGNSSNNGSRSDSALGGVGQSAKQKTVPVKDEYDGDNLTPSGFQRGAPMTNSMRRKIALAKGMRSPTQRGQRVKNEGSGDHNNSSAKESELGLRTSEESLDDLGVGDEDWEDENEGGEDGEKSSGVFLERRDSKRFSFKGKDGIVIDRVVEGLFVESKNTNPKGTLRRIRAPLNLTGDYGDDLDSPEVSLVGLNESEIARDEAKSQKSQRKKISVDENILSVMSSDMDDVSQATDNSQSDVFHSIINNTLTDEDRTMRTENGSSDSEVTLDIDTPDDMQDSIMGQLESIATSPMDRIPPLPVDSPEEDECIDDSMRWKPYRVGPADVQIDLQAIHPYRKCLSHGGYFDAEKNVAIILFSGCYLPDRGRKEYTYLMDHLFLYVLSTLEELIVDDYILVYLHGATPKSCMPTYGWLKKCYQLIDHRLRKNLKGLYLVHPTFWLRTVVALTRPFVSTKFSRKNRFINTLSDLCLEIPTEHLVIPDRVLQYDFDLKVDDLKRRKLMS